MLWTMVKRIKKIGARPILATGKLEENRSIVMMARNALADVWCEEEAPEWDLVSRFIHMADRFGIDAWIEQSGDCPFVDFSTVDELWKHISTGKYDSVGVERAYAGVAERALGAKHVSWYRKAHEYLSLDDRGREQPGIHMPKDVLVEYTVKRSRPASVTPIKSSIDWPLEGAIADLIVRYLGHWPETDDDIERVYREIRVLNPEINNTPPILTIINSKKDAVGVSQSQDEEDA